MGSVNVKGGLWARQIGVSLSSVTLAMGLVWVTPAWAADTVASPPRRPCRDKRDHERGPRNVRRRGVERAHA